MTYQYEQPLLVSRLGHMSMSPPELATAMSSASKLSAPAPNSPPQQPTKGLASDVQTVTTQVPEKKRRASRHRSTGCGTCRKRKIKCDEQKPTCLNCQKTGRECLGYRTPEELARPHFAKQPRANQSERQYGQKAKSDYMGNFSNLSDMDLRHEFGQSYREPAHSMFQETPMSAAPFAFGTCPDEQEMPPIDLIWNAQALPTSVTRLETFFFRRFISSIWLHSYSDMWRKMLPGLMNTSAPLYHSILAVSAMYMYKIGIDNRARDSAFSHYSLAVTHLQQALYTPDKAFQDTTLMATVIMGFYEMLDKDDHKSWCAHTKGAQQLIRMRGLRATGHGIGKMLFLTLRGFETVRAMLEYEETIFADEKWTVMCMNPATRMQAAELLEGPCPPVTAKQLMSSPPVDYACVLYMLGSKVGSCQAKAHKLFKQKRLDMSHKMAIDADLSSIIERLHHWRELLPSTYDGKDAPSSLPMSPFRTILIYGSSIQAQQICFYSAFLLQAYRVKAKYVLVDATCLPSDAQDLARTIIRVADFISAGLTTSSLQITWPLYAASIALENPDEQRWARRMLKAIAADKGWAIAKQALKAHSVVSLRDRAAGKSPATSASSAEIQLA